MPSERFELSTSPLPMVCSTPELRRPQNLEQTMRCARGPSVYRKVSKKERPPFGKNGWDFGIGLLAYYRIIDLVCSMIRLSWLETRGLLLWVWCEGCCHNISLEPGPLHSRLGDCEVPKVGRHLRCSQCGGRDVTTRPNWPKSGVGARHGPKILDPKTG